MTDLPYPKALYCPTSTIVHSLKRSSYLKLAIERVLLTINFKPRSIELKDNTVIIVLGASGDLAKKKTVCARSPG